MKYKAGDKARIKSIEQLKHDHYKDEDGKFWESKEIYDSRSSDLSVWAISLFRQRYCGTIQEIDEVWENYNYYHLKNRGELWQDWMIQNENDILQERLAFMFEK